MKKKLQQLLKQSLASLVADGVLDILVDDIRIDHSKDKTQGDFATNIAMVLAKRAGYTPRMLAEKIVATLPSVNEIERIEIAGSGFINFFIASDSSLAVIDKIITKGSRYGCSNFGNGQKVLLEFVSANPTGPLHVGHGRGAAYGATVANLLRALGFKVDCEYYVNDAGRQMDILTTSVYLRYVKIKGDKFPNSGYKGDYIFAIAKKISGVAKLDIFTNVCKDEKDGGDKEKHIDDLIGNCKTLLGDDYKTIFDLAVNSILSGIKSDLSSFGVEYQKWFFEQSLVDRGLVKSMLEKLQMAGNIYQKNGALWFKTTNFGDNSDRVVVRDNKTSTYFASDIAYHSDKFRRGYDKIINIWGADHHGYAPRVKAAIKALGFDENKLEILLVQFAHLFRSGVKVPMSTRDGSFVTLQELCREVGIDAARFFYVLRKSEQHMDFDLDLAKSKSNENPVFYIQYAHARIFSVLEKAQIHKPYTADLTLLKNQYECDLVKQLNRYQDVLQNAACNYEPHTLAYYLRDLAGDFHSYYNNSEFLVKDKILRQARLSLIIAIKQILSNGLNLLGVGAPDKM